MEIDVRIEIPKGSRNKYEWDYEAQTVRFDRMLFSPVHYPTDYGFVPDTLALDGDALDALVLVWEPTFPGCLIRVKPIGVFQMADDKGDDAKLLCVPLTDPHWSRLNTLDDVPPHLLQEITHFFTVYKELEKKKTRVDGWMSREVAEAVLLDAQKRYPKKS